VSPEYENDIMMVAEQTIITGCGWVAGKTVLRLLQYSK
jgi:hypothetical protein